ncbi:MAG: Gfo/Idh/MocA family oxidoreductase [Chitinophagaceae bacterium]|nr:Gfo/Idh/MocA family oxidoreductase [Chitinophagaceae bacterium]
MSVSRRKFVKNVSLTAAGLSVLQPIRSFAGTAAEKVRLGFIGVGLRGQSHLTMALNRNDVEVVSVCDIDPRMLQMAREVVQKSGKKMPAVFTGDNYAYRKLLAAKNIDAVVIATPWEWHTPMILDSIGAGLKYVATEVVLGITLEDHWEVVRAAESNQANVMMLENACYRRDILAVLNMVRQGLFGELMHLQGGYQHDLRGVKFNDGKTPYNSGAEFGEKGFSEARWRTNHSVHRNGDLYPTHDVGPLAMLIDINRGNRFESLSSFSTKSRGLHNYIVKKGGENHPNAQQRFKLGDIVTTQLKCANGETVFLQHDTNLPRPYSLGFRVQGTNGIWMNLNNGIFIEGQSKYDHEHWDDAKTWFDKYDHPLWKKWGAEAQKTGHDGIDFFVLHAFIESVKRKTPTPMDVYDAASWSAITPLSESSIALGNETVSFPDFTGGQWINRKNDFAATDQY